MKTIVITGANSGIGKALAFISVRNGMKVIAVCRQSEKTNSFFKELKSEARGIQPILVTGDLSLKSEIYRIVETISKATNKIDILINNAGVYKIKKVMSEENIEMTMAVNLLATVRLTEGLRNNYSNMDIVNITSELFKKGKIDINELEEPKKYNAGKRYNDSKLAIVYYSQWLSEKNSNNRVIAMHPGVVSTNAFREYPKLALKFLNLFLQKPEKAAKKILEPIVNDKITNGYYFYQNEKKDKLIEYINPQLKNKFIDEIMKYL